MENKTVALQFRLMVQMLDLTTEQAEQLKTSLEIVFTEGQIEVLRRTRENLVRLDKTSATGD